MAEAPNRISFVLGATPEAAGLCTGAVERLGQLACSEDAKLSKQALSVLAALAKSSPEQARAISACAVLDALPSCLQSQDDGVRKDAASLIQQVRWLRQKLVSSQYLFQ